MALIGNLRGKRAEQAAEKYLKKQGLKIVERNRRYPCGEIDIIAADSNTHIFVEVKFRSDSRHGDALEQVFAAKQIKLARAAKRWLQEHDPHFQRACRFDVIAIDREGSKTATRWIKNAFSPELW